MEKEVTQLLALLRPARQAKEMSQSQLADIIGVSDRAISVWELGTKTPRSEALERIKAWLAEVKAEPEPAHIKELKEMGDYLEETKRCLLSLEFILRYFVNGKVEAREMFRQELDGYDMGYLISCLEAMGNEARYQRWKMMSTYKFNSFRRLKYAGKGKDKS